MALTSTPVFTGQAPWTQVDTLASVLDGAAGHDDSPMSPQQPCITVVRVGGIHLRAGIHKKATCGLRSEDTVQSGREVLRAGEGSRQMLCVREDRGTGGTLQTGVCMCAHVYKHLHIL